MSARVYGLTGQTGAGKSTVCRILGDEGFSVIDCDALTRRVQSPNTPCVAALAAAFGQEILLEGGALNRKKLAHMAFGDEKSLQKLNRTVYPYIMAELKLCIKALSHGQTNGIVLDAPTLFQSGADALCDEVIAVVAPKAQRLARIVARDGLTEQEALARMASQPEDAFYTVRARYVIENSATPEALCEKARGVAQKIRENKAGEVVP